MSDVRAARREPLVLREATAADAEAIASLVNVAYLAEAPYILGDRTDAGDIRNHMDEGRFLLVDGEDGSLAACIYLSERDGRGYFGMLSVDPGSQGRGLGYLLVAEAERRLSVAGFAEVEILVVSTREPLFPWYEKLGYERVGTEPFSQVERMRVPVEFVVLRKGLDG